MVRVLVNPAAPAFDLWWEAAEAVGGSAPGPMLRILMGADVIHITEFEAADIKAWASTIKGGIHMRLTTNCHCCSSSTI